MSSAYLRLPGSGHYLRKELRLAHVARRAAFFALILLAVALAIFRLGGIDARVLAASFSAAASISAVTLLVAAGGLAKAWTTGASGGRVALGGLALSVLGLVPFLFAGYLAATNPPVAEAATPGLLADEAGLERGELLSGGTLPTLVDGTVLVGGRRFSQGAPSIYAAARAVLKANGWSVTRVLAGSAESVARQAAGPAGDDLGISGLVTVPIPTPRAEAQAAGASDPLDRPDAPVYRIEAVARDLVFALPSEVEIRIAEGDGETVVDLHSASETLAMDFGQNRRFIESFLTGLDAAVLAQETEQAGG